MPGQLNRHNVFFPLTIVLGTLFSVTILAVLAATLGDPTAPINAFLDERAGTILGCEAVGILATGFLAMTVDRRRTLQERHTPENQIENPAASTESNISTENISTEEEPVS